MRDLSVSCSAGYLNSTPLLDLNYVEDSAGGADVTVGILPKLDKVTLLQLPMETFETVFALASEGCKAIAERVRKVLQENTKQLEYRRLQKKVTETELADEITVVCNGMEGAYIRKFHVIECKCGSCGAKKQSPCEWEQHTGCRAKKWKYSVKVKGTMLTLEKWDIRSGDDALFAGR
ncbi:hypothetical protein F2Q70_00044238 [Brassica cretica]|uniref:Exoribonuclease phosphorolytic domain-containing protein n=1 Tax=Brassica cretica TaxID=69181 RepID=A0A8S9KEB4_BRACR|nr:hypothetical protein F2Q70_00044238 [Brassica cretica]